MRDNSGKGKQERFFETVRAQFLPEVETLFGVEHGDYDAGYVREVGAERVIPTGDPDFMARFPKWPPFKSRNLGKLLKTTIQTDPGFSIWLNATVTDFDVDTATGRLRELSAQELLVHWEARDVREPYPGQISVGNIPRPSSVGR